MEATLDRKSTNNLDILLKAVSEKEVSGKVDTRWPSAFVLYILLALIMAYLLGEFMISITYYFNV